jgi:uncharacterized protein YdaU (DUF1376 family)
MDLTSLSYMPLHVERLLASDTWMIATGDEAKAAVTLWCRAWHQVPAGSLPNDDRLLAALSGAGAKWKKVKEVALRGFKKGTDGRLHHAMLQEEAKEAFEKRAKWRDKKRRQRGGQAGEVPAPVPGNMPEDNRGETPLRDGTGREGRELSASHTVPNPEKPDSENSNLNDKRIAQRSQGSVDYSQPANRDAFANNKVHEVLSQRTNSADAWMTIFAARDPKDPNHRTAREACEQIARSIKVRWQAEVAA